MTFLLPLLLALYIIIVLIGIFILVYHERKKYTKELEHEHTLLEIIVSKNVEEEKRGPLAMEQVISSFYSMYEKSNFITRWFGDVQPRISFEIMNKEGKIHFYIWVRHELKNLIESQIYGQYPDVEIYERSDYSHELIKYKSCMSLNLDLHKPDVFPIKKYKQFEDLVSRKIYDSMQGIISSISKIDHKDDIVALQIIISPLTEKWYKWGMKDVEFVSKSITSNMRLYYLSFTDDHQLFIKIIKTIVFPITSLIALIRSFIPRDAEMEQDLEKMQRGEEIRDDTVNNSLLGKLAKLAFNVMIRITYASNDTDSRKIKSKMKEIAGSFKQFNLPHLNGFEPSTLYSNKELVVKNTSTRRIRSTDAFTLNTEELAGVFHLPILTFDIPNIEIITSRTLPPPLNLPRYEEGKTHDITLLGKTNFRSSRYMFGIKEKDRRRHIYIIGKTGMGKSTLLENMIYADVMNGKGVAVVDPHGDLADKVVSFIPSSRTNDAIVFSPSDTDHPISFNMLENVNPEHRSIIASGLVGVFKKIYGEESWGPRLEYILRNTILSLLEYPNSSMLGIMRILTDDDFREKVVNKITDPVVRSFWLTEFNRMQEKNRIEAISPIQNKVGQFLSSHIIRNIVGQPKSSINLRWAMDNKKIVIVNLSKGKIGEDNSALLGSMMITKFQIDAMSRANIPEKERVDFYLYVDEFQNFATGSFATILSEARKYRLNLNIANQYIAQMPDEVREAVFGNVGTTISFQVGFEDAEALSGQFNEEVLPPDFIQLPVGSVYMKMLVDNMPTNTFSAHTMPPMEISEEEERREKIIKVSRERYGSKKEFVEDKIKKWAEQMNTQLDNKGYYNKPYPKKAFVKKTPEVKKEEKPQQNKPAPAPKKGGKK